MILVAVGANLSDRHGASPVVTCRAAAEALRSLPGLRVVALSQWYRTAPVPPSGQPDSCNGPDFCMGPDFCNGIVRLDGHPDPAWLLGRLHMIEARAGRVRTVANAPRVLDLDLIECNETVSDGPVLLPHPRAHERGFVLYPLRDVAPDWVHPVFGLSVATLINDLAAQRVEPI